MIAKALLLILAACASISACAQSGSGQSGASRPQTPLPPFPYTSEEVSYSNPDRVGVKLAGTLTLPQGSGPYPVVLLISGSGAQDRDESLLDHKPFLVLADYLTRRGIAVLRVDDRGVGGSTGASAGDTTADFASDVVAGIAWLASRKEIDRERIGLLGHSEGGTIAPMVASKDSRVMFVVLVAAPAMNGADIIVEQVRALNLAAGRPTFAANASASTQRRIVDAVLSGGDEAGARTAVTTLMANLGAPPLDEITMRQLTSAWYRYFLAYDPAPSLRALRIPVLAINGDRDVQVPTSRNEPAMRSALEKNARAEVVVLSGLNHLLQTADTGAVTEYQQIEETIAPQALKAIGDWVQRTVGSGSSTPP
ncbi:MAG: alpha/beta fold hydrolase [Steroidobacteraceae bacterium]